MLMMLPLEPIFAEFVAEAAFASAEPFTAGHINDSYLVTTRSRSARRFLLQRINTEIFRDVAGLMRNVQRVTGHLDASTTRDYSPRSRFYRCAAGSTG